MQKWREPIPLKRWARELMKKFEAEQPESFNTKSAAARATAASEMDVATKTDTIATEQEGVAGQQPTVAN